VAIRGDTWAMSASLLMMTLMCIFFASPGKEKSLPTSYNFPNLLGKARPSEKFSEMGSFSLNGPIS
jgi:hypothetical protein